jgi:hypothetical protein
MGTWGYEAFENDDANDWLITISHLSAIEAVFVSILNCDEYIELPEASIVIAGAEVVANLIQEVDISSSQLLKQWQKLAIEQRQSLINSAKQAIAKVIKESELQLLWLDPNDYEQWQSSINSLVNRLDAPPNSFEKLLSPKKSLMKFKFKGDSYVFKGENLSAIFEVLYQENFRLYNYTRREYIVEMISRCQLEDKVNGKECSPEELIQILTTNKILVQLK